MSDKPFIEKIYNLSENPFSNWVDPNVEMAGRAGEKKRWEDVVSRKKGANANVMCFIYGDYGFGKTLSLYKIVEQYEDDKEILPIFVKMLSEDRTSKFGVDFIQRIFRQIPPRTFKQFNLDDINYLEKYFSEPSRLFARIVLGDDGMLALALDYICGLRTVSGAEMKKIGVNHKFDSTEVAKKYLLCFLYLLGAKKKTLLVAVDETEYVFSQMNGASIAQVFNTLRDLVDLHTTPSMPMVKGFSHKASNMIFFFGISTGGWKQFDDLIRREQSKPGPVQALKRRLEPPIELQPLIIKETRELIEKRLTRNRVEGVNKKTLLIPYDESFINYIQELSLGNPSEIVKYCDFALEDGLKDKVKILNEEFARKVFLERGLIFDDN